MKKNKHYFSIGLFVLLGFAILALACVLFGGGQLFTKKLYFETYFPTSVEGLSIGSQVKLRGIPLGEVESITFAGAVYEVADDAEANAREQLRTLSYVRVLCSIDITQHPDVDDARLSKMVEGGLRAKLTSAGITGGAFITLDYERTATATLTFPWEPENLYIPSEPSTLQNVLNVVDDLTEQLEKIDLNRTTEALISLVETIDKSVAGANFPALSASTTQALDQLSSLLASLQTVMAQVDAKALAADMKAISGNLAQLSTDLRAEVPQLTKSATATVTQLETTLADTSVLLKKTAETFDAFKTSIDPEAIGADLTETLTTLTRTAASLEALVNELRQKPSRILFDDPIE